MINYKERLRILSNITILKQYYELFTLPIAESCIKFIETFCFTYDPRRKEDKVIPFTLYDKQKKYIYWLWKCLSEKKNGLVDKCRDVGATWCFVAFSVWLILFHKDISIGFFTYKEKECDKKGDISTLFGKVRFLLERLPQIFRENITDNYMYIRNEKMNSDIAGASGDNPGRSGRRTMFFKDEAAFYQHAESIEASLSETTDVQIDISTHAGADTLFCTKIESSESEVFEFNWWDIPSHNQEWYDKKKKEAIEKGLLHIFKREIERDPYGSIESTLISMSWLNVVSENKETEEGKIIAALDVADEGSDTNVLTIREGNNLIYIDEWGEGDTGKTATRALWTAIEYGCTEFRYDAIGVGAGIKATVRMIQEENQENEKLKNIKIRPWNASGAVIRPKDQDYNDIENSRFFENAKAQAYWKLREYVYNTYKKIIKEKYDSSKCISFAGVKDNGKYKKMLAEISQVQHRTSSSGKLMIEKKPKGKKSPNICESVVINFAEIEPDWIAWEAV